MPPEPAALRSLVSILESDLSAIDKRNTRIDRLAGEIERASADDDQVWMAAMALHHLYNALEHAFSLLAVVEAWRRDRSGVLGSLRAIQEFARTAAPSPRATDG